MTVFRIVTERYQVLEFTSLAHFIQFKCRFLDRDRLEPLDTDLQRTYRLLLRDVGLRDFLDRKEYLWIDVYRPSSQVLLTLQSMFKIHNLTIEDVEMDYTTEKIETHDNYIFLMLESGCESDHEGTNKAAYEADTFLQESAMSLNVASNEMDPYLDLSIDQEKKPDAKSDGYETEGGVMIPLNSMNEEENLDEAKPALKAEKKPRFKSLKNIPVFRRNISRVGASGARPSGSEPVHSSLNSTMVYMLLFDKLCLTLHYRAKPFIDDMIIRTYESKLDLAISNLPSNIPSNIPSNPPSSISLPTAHSLLPNVHGGDLYTNEPQAGIRTSTSNLLSQVPPSLHATATAAGKSAFLAHQPILGTTDESGTLMGDDDGVDIYLPSAVDAKKSRIFLHPMWITYIFLDYLTDLMQASVKAATVNAEAIEDMIFDIGDNEYTDLLRRFQVVRKSLNGHVRKIKIRKEIIQFLLKKVPAGPKQDKAAALHLRDVLDLVSELKSSLMSHHDALSDSQNLYMAQISVQLNYQGSIAGEKLAILSKLSMIFLPLHWLVGLMGVNIQVPLQSIENSYPFYGFLGLNIIVCIIAWYGFLVYPARQEKKRTY